MFNILYRQRRQREAQARATSARHAPSEDGILSIDAITTNHPPEDLVRLARAPPRPSRRQYRSRNCHNFRLYGAFFQFADPVADRQLGVVRRGQRYMGSRAGSRHENEMQRQLEHLQSRVKHLRQQRDLIESRMINSTDHAVSHAMVITRRFYELFSRGFDRVQRPAFAREAESFLYAMMVEDVKCTEFVGVSHFIKQYEVSTASHASVMILLKDVTLLDCGEKGIRVKAEARARLRISRESLILFFPSIIQDEELTQQLIGKQYEMQYDKVFHFADGRIFQHESRIDMCTGLLEMVGSPMLAVKLFEASLMTKHGHWKIDNEVAEDRNCLENSAL